MNKDLPKTRIRSARPREKIVIRNLLQLYLHDFSEFEPIEMSEQGTMDYPFLESYWRDPDRFPFLIHHGEHLAGFILIRVLTHPANGRSVTEIAEFFVLRGYRRQGVGSSAARQALNQFEGPWEVDVLISNRHAYPFWVKLIEEFTRGDYREETDDRLPRPRIRFMFATPASR